MAYTQENYIIDYNDAYGSILKNAMENTTIGVDTPLEKLFNLIDENSGDTTALERLSMKKEAYMQILGTLSAQSQQTAIALVDKKYGFQNELEMMEQKVVGEKIKNGYVLDPVTEEWVFDIENSEAYLANKVKKAQIALTKRQAEAFDDNKDKEILKVAMEGHAMLFETLQDDTTVIPNWYVSDEDLGDVPGFKTLMESARTTEEIIL